MKTVFIINPCAGKKKDVDAFINKIYVRLENLWIFKPVFLTKGERLNYG